MIFINVKSAAFTVAEYEVPGSLLDENIPIQNMQLVGFEMS